MLSMWLTRGVLQGDEDLVTCRGLPRSVESADDGEIAIDGGWLRMDSRQAGENDTDAAPDEPSTGA